MHSDVRDHVLLVQNLVLGIFVNDYSRVDSHVFLRTPQLDLDPKTVLTSHVPVLDTQADENLTFSFEHIPIDRDIHSDLDQPVVL